MLVIQYFGAVRILVKAVQSKNVDNHDADENTEDLYIVKSSHQRIMLLQQREHKPKQ